jgi:NTE family protein
MVRALLGRGVVPDTIVATSVGAVKGAFLASHGATAKTVDELAALWLRVRRGQIYPLEPLTGLLGFLGARRNLVPGGALRRAKRYCTHGARSRTPCSRAQQSPDCFPRSSGTVD